MIKSKVYFTHEITPEAMIKMYDILNISLPGKVAVKLHSGEVGNQNFLSWFSVLFLYGHTVQPAKELFHTQI
jgi:hypothetical protein